MAPATKHEAFPLAWPDGWVRTRIQDRKAQSQWKLSVAKYRETLIKECERMGVTSLVISSNVPLNLRGDMTAGIEPRDPGVAVYFSRPVKEDYSWQEVLNIHNPDPTLEQIDSAYRELAKKYHPDAGGDLEMFKTVTQQRDRARAWVSQKDSGGQQYVLACDQFKEVRLNLNAIRLTIAAIRQIERCGTSSLLERAFRGFTALTAQGEGGGNAQ